MTEVALVDDIPKSPSPTPEDGANTTSKDAPTTPVSRQESTTSLQNSSAKDKEVKFDEEIFVMSDDEGETQCKQVHRRTLSSEKLAKFKPSFKKSDAPISKELSERARSAPLVKKFALPSTETLINDYSAALLKHILIHGRMYLSQNYICFESKIFGIKTMEVIPFKDVTHMSKTSKKLKFAHGVQVTTSSQTYYFASFVSREKAFGMLTKIWREHVPKTDSHDDDEEDDDDDGTGTQDYESDDSSLRRKDKKASKEHSDLKLGRSIESQPDRSDEREKGLRRFSSPLLNRVLPNSSNSQGSPKHGSMSHLSSSATNLEMLTDANNPNASPPIAAPSLPSVSAPTTPVPSPPESEDEDEGMYDEGDGFLGSEAQYQQILSVNFPVNVKTFFKIFFSDDSTFTQSYHITRGDKDLVVKPWSNSPQFGLIRDVLYLSPVKVPLGPSHTRITETQRYHLTKNRLVIDTIAMMLDIPYGDSFRVEGKWDITLVGTDSCKLAINIGVHFMKKTWFKGKIETQTIKETKESFQQWAALAPAEITKYNLAHPSRPSTPATSSTSNLLTTSQTSATSSSTSPSPSSSLTQLPSPPPARVSSSTVTQTTSSSTESITTSTVSYAPSPNLGRKSVDGGKLGLVNKLFSSVPNPVQGFSLVHILLVLIFGLVFIHMYMRIAYLEGRVETLETILQPLVTKALSLDK